MFYYNLALHEEYRVKGLKQSGRFFMAKGIAPDNGYLQVSAMKVAIITGK